MRRLVNTKRGWYNHKHVSYNGYVIFIKKSGSWKVVKGYILYFMVVIIKMLLHLCFAY